MGSWTPARGSVWTERSAEPIAAPHPLSTEPALRGDVYGSRVQTDSGETQSDSRVSWVTPDSTGGRRAMQNTSTAVMVENIPETDTDAPDRSRLEAHG